MLLLVVDFFVHILQRVMYTWITFWTQIKKTAFSRFFLWLNACRHVYSGIKFASMHIQRIRDGII